jgi:hypothetical protein
MRRSILILLVTVKAIPEPKAQTLNNSNRTTTSDPDRRPLSPDSRQSRYPPKAEDHLPAKRTPWP